MIVSSIGLLLLLSCCGTESIPFYLYRTRRRLTERQSPQNDHRCVILQLLPLKFPCLLFHITLYAVLDLSDLNSVMFSPLPLPVKNGYSAAPIALTDGLDIRVNTAVKNIKYFPGGVEVTAENLKTNNSTVTYKGKF